MNKDILKNYKQIVKEIKQNDEIKANILYKEIWSDIILQYIVSNTMHNTFIFWLDDYIERYNINENAKRTLIFKLEKDGFKLGLRKEYPDAYGISTENTLKYINKDNKEINTESKIPITPFAELRTKTR